MKRILKWHQFLNESLQDPSDYDKILDLYLKAGVAQMTPHQIKYLLNPETTPPPNFEPIPHNPLLHKSPNYPEPTGDTHVIKSKTPLQLPEETSEIQISSDAEDLDPFIIERSSLLRSYLFIMLSQRGNSSEVLLMRPETEILIHFTGAPESHFTQKIGDQIVAQGHINIELKTITAQFLFSHKNKILVRMSIFPETPMYIEIYKNNSPYIKGVYNPQGQRTGTWKPLTEKEEIPPSKNTPRLP